MKKEELFDLIHECTTLDIFIAKVAKLICNPIWITNDAYELVACSKEPNAYPYLSFLQDTKQKSEFVKRLIGIGLLNENGIKKPMRIFDTEYRKDVYVVDIFAKKKAIAKLAVAIEHEISEEDVQLLADALSVYLRHQLTNSGTKREQAFTLLLQKDKESQQLGYDLLIESGYVVKGSYMLAYVNTTIVNRITVLSSFLSEIQKGYPSLLGGIVNEQCYILLPTSHRIDLKHYPDLYVGYSMVFEKLDSLYGYAKQAEYAGQIYRKRESYFETVIDTFICHQLENHLPLSTLVDQRIQNLIAYDKQYETKYYETLCMYVNSQYSKQKTAERLYIHLNTVKYRLQQIEKLFDIYFEKDEKLIRLAMLVHHV